MATLTPGALILSDRIYLEGEKMANSTVTLYTGCDLNQERNWQLDDIEEYLEGLHMLTVDMQYIKQGLKIKLKVRMPQNELDGAFENGDYFNYASIKNSTDNMTYYYFIAGKKWASADCVELDLVQDTLNTWQGKYEMTKRTKILRQHKDRLEERDVNFRKDLTYRIGTGEWIPEGTGYRANVIIDDEELKNCSIDEENSVFTVSFKTVSTATVTVDNIDLNPDLGRLRFTAHSTHAMLAQIDVYALLGETRLARKIDKTPEGLNVILNKKDLDDVELVDDTHNGVNWVLWYKSGESQSDKVVCYLSPVESGYKARTVETDLRIIPSDLVEGRMYSITATDQPGWNIDTIITVYDTQDNTKLFDIYRKDPYLPFQKVDRQELTDLQIVNGKLSFKRLHSYKHSWGDIMRYKSEEFTGISGLRFERNDQTPRLINYYDHHDSITLRKSAITEPTTFDLTAFKDIDRTDPTLLKCILLPYCPSGVEYKVDGTDKIFEVDELIWDNDGATHAFRYKMTNPMHSLRADYDFTETYNPFKELDLGKIQNFYVDTAAERDDKYESKLYHSDFYRPKFVYDSFGFNFELEKMNKDVYYEFRNFTMSFATTTTLNSRFMFRFYPYYLEDSTSDYSNCLTVNRNNELPIYNSAYMNYIRTGYNYDVKAKELAFQNSLSTLAFNTARGMSTGGYAGAVLGAASGLIGMVNAQDQAQLSIDRKLAETKAQGLTVSTCDSYDLLLDYTNDNAKMATYGLDEQSKANVSDLFYYCGYRVDRQEKPNTTSRYWFNFLQCEPDINKPQNMTDEMKVDLSNRLKGGITVFHHREGRWELDQTRENWELRLV